MSRKPADDDGSLDLLLDTICNTFGGVLFISMLVIVLLNSTSEQVAMSLSDESSQAELIESEARLAQTNEKLEALEMAMRQQQLVAQQIADPDVLRQVQLLRQSQLQSTDLLRKKTKGLGEMVESTKVISSLTQKMKIEQEQLQNAEKILEAIQRQLQQEIASRTKAAKLPRARQTNKREGGVLFLRDGRLCSYSRDHLDEFVEKLDGQKRYVEPKPGTGILINPERQGELNARLDEFDPAKDYLAIFVWPDSFDQFAIVKDRMVSKGFEYRLEPFHENGKIYLGQNSQPIVIQ